MNKGKMFALAIALMVTPGLVAVASQSSQTNSAKQAPQTDTHTKDKMNLHHETGKADSLAADQLVLDHTWRGKERKTTFTLDSSTKKEGNVEKGDRVMVYYHFENGHRIATELKTMAAKPKTEANKS
jgi:hypothetical protein